MGSDCICSDLCKLFNPMGEKVQLYLTYTLSPIRPNFGSIFARNHQTDVPKYGVIR